jgi:hypothetical protein
VMAVEAWPNRADTTLAGIPAFSERVAYVCLRSCLCRRRHKHDYADPRVMPTSARNPLHDGVSVLAVSA